jgi:glyoxylase-like metal-dependent hydrolase (beta-lactamase superfamily II)
MTAGPAMLPPEPPKSLSSDPLPLVAGLWRIGGGSWNNRTFPLSAESDANVYLLENSGSRVLIDCGTKNGLASVRANLAHLDADCRSVDDLLLTHSHWDHAEAAAKWQADSVGLRTHLNSVGDAFLRRGDHRLVGYQLNPPPPAFEVFRVDHTVGDDETFELGRFRASAHHMPGHTPDSTLFTVHLDGVTVGFCGDIVFQLRPNGRPVLGQLCSLWMSNLDQYVESLRRMLAIPIDLLLPGHGGPVHGAVAIRQAVAATLELAVELAEDERIRDNVGV